MDRIHHLLVIFPLQIHLLQFLLTSYLAMSQTNTTTDQEALLKLKPQIKKDQMPNILSQNWTSNTSICSWIGIVCNMTNQRVVALNVSNMGLTGPIPPEIGNLSFLSSLDMSFNDLKGNLPIEFAKLKRLKFIDMSSNNLNGEIPSWFGLLLEVEFLSLANNSFNGSIPSALFDSSRAEFLDLGNNSPHGEIPMEIGKLRGLKLLNLMLNKLGGFIPEEIGSLTMLETLHISDNNFEGMIPEKIGKLPNLKVLAMRSNILIGSVPFALFNSSSLQILDLSNNSLSGSLPGSIHLPQIEELYLRRNHLHGEIPRAIGNLTTVKKLYLNNNPLRGKIPEEISKLNKLEELVLQFCNLDGMIPAQVFNISTLRIIGFTGNNLSGDVPSSICYTLPNLEEIYLNLNSFTGAIPSSMSNCSKLNYLEIADNQFTGVISSSFGNLRSLDCFSVSGNYLTSEPSSPELNFLTSLTNCTHLRDLRLSGNPLNGTLPASIGNFSDSIQTIYALGCGIRGSIPLEVGKLNSLNVLSLSFNELTGSIPQTISGLKQLQRLYLRGNRIVGPLPASICEMTKLGEVYLSQNQLFGPIPDCVGYVTSLRELFLDSNKFNGSLSISLWNLNDLIQLNLSSNSITGTLPPDVRNLKAAILIDISRNQLSGTIPSMFGDLKELVNFSLACNRLEGPIPESFGNMSSLEYLDLSQNHLTSLIPKSLASLDNLKYLNVSFNKFQGEIPNFSHFTNMSSLFFLHNDELCSDDPKFNVSSCSSRSRREKLLRPILIPTGTIAIVVVSLALIFWFIKLGRRNKALTQIDILPVSKVERISYYKILAATNNFSEENKLGSGSFGSVYKAILSDGMPLAVKVFNPQLEDKMKSFDIECEMLRNLRHRNLVKVISSCSNLDIKAIVLEYMPNGNLKKRLYCESDCLDIVQMLDIMIDVACALEYLHHGYTTTVVHCDLKPSNILLDQNMVAHVSDFGIAKLLEEGESIAYTKTLATMGYIAPEYGSEGIVSTKCDVYSYGIVLMEVFTRKMPNDEMFSGDLSLKSWIRDSIPDRVAQIVDRDLLMPDDEQHYAKKLKCLTSIMLLALQCTTKNPRERVNIEDVVPILAKIRCELHASCIINSSES